MGLLLIMMIYNYIITMPSLVIFTKCLMNEMILINLSIEEDKAMPRRSERETERLRALSPTTDDMPVFERAPRMSARAAATMRVSAHADAALRFAMPPCRAVVPPPDAAACSPAARLLLMPFCVVCGVCRCSARSAAQEKAQKHYLMFIIDCFPPIIDDDDDAAAAADAFSRSCHQW